MTTGSDHAWPSNSTAEPVRSTATQKLLVGQDKPCMNAPGSIGTGSDHCLPSYDRPLPSSVTATQKSLLVQDTTEKAASTRTGGCHPVPSSRLSKAAVTGATASSETPTTLGTAVRTRTRRSVINPP